MTLQETLDEIARLKGWRRFGQGGSLSDWWGRDKVETFEHPVPATLDAIAALWPHRRWGIAVDCYSPLGKGWDAVATRLGHPTGDGEFRHVYGETELEARAALLLAVLRHEKEAQ